MSGQPGELAYVAAVRSGPGALPARFIRRLRGPARRVFGGGTADVPSKLIEDFDATVTLGGTAKELGLAQGDRRLAALFGAEDDG